jgi:hypothetical protein
MVYLLGALSYAVGPALAAASLRLLVKSIRGR